MTPHHAYSAFIERALRHTEALGNGRTHQFSPRWTRLLTLMVVLLCMAGAACSRPEPSPLRVGTNIWPGYEPLYVARHLGYLDTNQVRLVEFTSTSQILRAFRNGAIDAACVTIDEALLLAQEAADVRLVLVFDISNGADVIMAKPGIADLKDLKGRRVGAETTALGAYVLMRALQSSGLTPRDVQIVPLEVSEHESAFKRGDVDAVVTFEPTRTKLRNFGARQVFDSSEIPGEIVDVLAVRSQYLQAHPDAVEHLLQGWYRTLNYMKEKPQDAARIAAARMGSTAEEFLASFEGLRLPDATETRRMLTGDPPLLLKNAQALADVMREHGLLQKEVEIQSLFDERAINRVLP